MSKSLIFILTIVNIVVAIIVASMAAITIVYAQSKATTQQANYSNTTTHSPIKGLNASTIIEAINTRIKSVYDDEEESLISKIRH